MVKKIQDKIKTLQSELKSIDYTNSRNNLTLGKYEDKRRLEIISKIQVLNEILIDSPDLVKL